MDTYASDRRIDFQHIRIQKFFWNSVDSEAQRRYNYNTFGWFAKSKNVRIKCRPITSIPRSYVRKYRCAVCAPANINNFLGGIKNENLNGRSYLPGFSDSLQSRNNHS